MVAHGVTDQRAATVDSKLIAYRPDIDGLRAVAVVSVILYHLKRGLLPAGFLGVDVFFVISGYLIGLILWRELDADAFSLRRFYERRVRRIMPALLTVLAATTLGAAVVLPPVALVAYAQSALATLAFVANVYFLNHVDYWMTESSQAPLLHMWSLGIEEQFYLFFPLLLFVCARLFRRWTPAIVAVVLVASFAWDVVLQSASGGGRTYRLLLEVTRDPCLRETCGDTAFYLLPTRAWEFAAGALIVFAQDWPRVRPWSDLLGLAGLVLVAAAIFFGSRGFLTPAAPAVLGTAMLIWSGARRAGPAYAALGSKPAVAIGLVSYSLYLWHWPVLVLSRYWIVGDPPLPLTIAAIVVFSGAAFLSWRFVERPFRSSRMPLRQVLVWVAAGIVLVGAAAVAIVAGRGFPARFPLAAVRLSAALDDLYECPQRDFILVGRALGCAMALPSRDPADADVVLIGNSHARMYAPLVAEILAERHLRGVLLTEDACLPSISLNLSRLCLRQAGDYIDAAAASRAKVVMIALAWERGHRRGKDPADTVRPDYLAAAVADTVARLEKAGKTVVLIGPIARPGWPVTLSAARLAAFGTPMPEAPYRSRAAFEQELQPVFAAFADRRDIIFIRPDLDQCEGDRCDFVRGGQALFTDGGHLAASSLGLFRPRFEAALDEAERRASVLAPGSTLAPPDRSR